MDRDYEIDQYECRHSGVAGMIIVHDDDLDGVAQHRARQGLRPIECESCDYVYSVPAGWHLPC